MPKPGDIPPCSGPPATRSSGRATKEYRISLITPLFGGGVEAATPDETLPIRGTSIRGHLQFWWRATWGARFASDKDLFTCHAEIWGTTDRPSPIEISVHDVTASQVLPCAGYEWNPNARHGQGGWRLTWKPPFAGSLLSYALFSFQGKQPASRHAVAEEEPRKFIETASFVLRLRYPEALRQDVETAVWAWVNFGGLGARTRRGCGALLCQELAPRDFGDLQRWFRGGSVNGEENARYWPTMPTSMLVGSGLETPVDAWKKIIALLQSFRQGEGVARNRGTQSGRPGRSRYPEPETIRRVTGQRPTQHPRLPHIPDDAFPRAEFGLPIVFHFQGQAEPPDTVLYPLSAPEGNARERMASPLILKPLAVANGKAVPLILRLNTPPLTGVVLKQGSNSLDLPETTVVRASRLAAYPDSPIARSASGSAVEAFLVHARNSGLSEIAR
jgi:CRISPR-associated protein Cmr1